FEVRVERLGEGSYRFTGPVHLATEDDTRGLEGRLDGEIQVHAGRLRRFRGFFQGKAWGQGTYTPGAPAGKFPLVIAMVETADPLSRIVGPQGAIIGPEYLRP
ncbi:MAG TPA: hypothetical protein VM328_06845, partial [Fimbriimonadaceae bacterium]|nr:hypothetical protein [Fimbriimonadaceae bacterium]